MSRNFLSPPNVPQMRSTKQRPNKQKNPQNSCFPTAYAQSREIQIYFPSFLTIFSKTKVKMYNLTRKSAQSIINISWACLVPPVLSHAIYSRKVLTNHLFRITRRKFLLSSKFTFDLVTCGKKHFDAGDSSVTRHARKWGRGKIEIVTQMSVQLGMDGAHCWEGSNLCSLKNIQIYKYANNIFRRFFLHLSKTILANSKTAFSPSSLPFLFYAQKKKGMDPEPVPPHYPLSSSPSAETWQETEEEEEAQYPISWPRYDNVSISEQPSSSLALFLIFFGNLFSPKMRKS